MEFFITSRIQYIKKITNLYSCIYDTNKASAHEITKLLIHEICIICLKKRFSLGENIYLSNSYLTKICHRHFNIYFLIKK